MKLVFFFAVAHTAAGTQVINSRKLENDELCGFKYLQEICTVDTSQDNWGNASKKQGNGEIRIQGKGVKGNCR